MLRRIMITTGTCAMLLAGAAFAADSPAVSPEKTTGVYEGSLIEPSQDDLRPGDEIFWDFITCTHTVQECQWEASHHGFHHYRAVHDQFTCGGHAHFACYGGHH